MNPLRNRPGSRRGALAVTMALPLLLTGCSKDVKDDLAHKTPPPTLSVDKAREKAGSLSSQILDMIAIKDGKVTEPGPGISTCDEDPGHLYKTRHPWSIYQVAPEELKAGFQRLREALPGHGWKIVDYGPDSSPNKNLELTADSQTERFSVNASLQITGDSGKKEPLLVVTVVSGCFKAPKGEDLNTEY
ncbi:hypothetical protein [Streptomyces sp. SID10815]|uniref:hypothetical protein n=1 Tax=Streptomyces sp. SID10815 TaxID=2706027 RepID=UPI0013C61307|nr:hypothetical protein [Streptomyces sp. SID10815]NEA48625.1 hypothetical protein [Streptomyces sp. SID10815]